MDLRSLKLHLLDRHLRLVLADADGEHGHDLEGEAFDRVMAEAGPLLAAVETRLGGACHLELRAISVDPIDRVVRVSTEGGESPGARIDGEAYDALARAIVPLARAAVAEVRPRRPRNETTLDAGFWDAIYREAHQGFELGRAAPPLVSYFAAHPPKRGARALQVGCGRGHDARLLAGLGLQVTAVDLSEEAIARARALTPPELTIEFVRADLFALPDDPAHAGRYHLVVEHTLFCAIAPEQREGYVRAMHRLLAPGGELVGLFFAHGREGGPPFSTSLGEIERLFSGLFTVASAVVPRDSVALRQGEELLVRLVRRA